MIRALVQHNRDAALVVEEAGRIVTHNTTLTELLEQPPGTRFDSMLRLGPINLQRILRGAALAAGEQDAVGRPSLRTLEFTTTLEFRQPPLPVRITSVVLPPQDATPRLRLVTLHMDEGAQAVAQPRERGSPLHSADAECRRQLELALRAVVSGAPLLLQGETGTGKTRLAHALHQASPRSQGPLVELHCGALADRHLESELFGHAAGAFPEATRERIGHLEAADGGTLVLDQIEAMSPRLQAALQRVLGDGRFQRLGEHQNRFTRVSLIATCGEDLRPQIAEGRFRGDLYYRLAGVNITLGALRERPGDLAAALDDWSQTSGLSLNPTQRQHLQSHPWPGNYWELQSLLHRLRLQADIEGGLADHAVAEALADSGDHGDVGFLLPPGGTETLMTFSPEETQERSRLAAVLAAHHGNRSQAARSLGMDRTTLWRKLHRLRLIPEHTKP